LPVLIGPVVVTVVQDSGSIEISCGCPWWWQWATSDHSQTELTGAGST